MTYKIEKMIAAEVNKGAFDKASGEEITYPPSAIVWVAFDEEDPDEGVIFKKLRDAKKWVVEREKQDAADNNLDHDEMPPSEFTVH